MICHQHLVRTRPARATLVLLLAPPHEGGHGALPRVPQTRRVRGVVPPRLSLRRPQHGACSSLRSTPPSDTPAATSPLAHTRPPPLQRSHLRRRGAWRKTDRLFFECPRARWRFGGSGRFFSPVPACGVIGPGSTPLLPTDRRGLAVSSEWDSRRHTHQHAE